MAADGMDNKGRNNPDSASEELFDFSQPPEDEARGDRKDAGEVAPDWVAEMSHGTIPLWTTASMTSQLSGANASGGMTGTQITCMKRRFPKCSPPPSPPKDISNIATAECRFSTVQKLVMVGLAVPAIKA